MKSLILSLLMVSYLGFSQKAPIKFGDVSLEEVKLKAYEPDSTAAAVVLVDYGSSTMEYNRLDNWFRLIFERTTRIKILKKDGYRYANFRIPVYQSVTSKNKEKLIGLKVVTYNLEDGKIVQSKIKPDGIFEEKYNQNYFVIKFTAPNVKEGSVVEVTYQIVSDFLHYFRDWEFQTTIPVVWSEYRASIPEFFNYEKFIQGYVPVHIIESKESPKSFLVTTRDSEGGSTAQTRFETDKIAYKELNYRWVVKDVPAFRNEPFMTTHLDYISKINFELAYYKLPNQAIEPVMGTWADLSKSFLESENFGRAVKGSAFLKKITDQVISDATTQQEKVAAIYKFVVTNMEWDSSYLLLLNDHKLKDAFDKKRGGSSHINLMLVSMLQKAGLDANPVILSTRDHGFVRESVAVSSQFNYVIAQVLLDGKSILLDATDRLLPMGVLPEYCLNGRGFVIANDNHGWVELGAPVSRASASAELELTEEGTFRGKLRINSDGYVGRHLRNVYLEKGEAGYIKGFEPGKLLTITKSAFKNIKELQEPFEEIHDFTWDGNSRSPGAIFLSPILCLNEAQNPFKLEKREYPVDFGSPFDKIFTLKLSIPDNFEIDEVPESKVIFLPNNGGRFLYNVQTTGNTINITSLLKISRSLFTSDDYPALREFYNIVVAKQAEQIVLKEK
jgi:hypothetical protein